MITDQSIIRSVAATIDHDEHFADRFAEKMAALHGVKGRVAGIRARIRAEAERGRNAMLSLQRELGAARRECTHPGATYHGDPAGGSDSCRHCSICDHTW